MPDFSIVCVISKPDVFEKCLLQSINENRGDFDVEIIPIFNDGNKYSASNALNVGIEVANSDVVILAHQDVKLLHDWFTNLQSTIENLDDWGVIGSAGISLDYGCADIGKWGGALNVDTVAVGSVWDSDENLSKVPYWDGIKDLTRVHCADECLMVVNRRTGLRCDCQFNGFHFYGVDLCLQARAAGYGVYCSYLPIIHYGKYSASFNTDIRYWPFLRFLYNKWHNMFPEVLGTHFHWTHNSNNIVGKIETVPELTSYIDMSLLSDDGCSVHLKALGLNKVRLKTDKFKGLLEY